MAATIAVAVGRPMPGMDSKAVADEVGPMAFRQRFLESAGLEVLVIWLVGNIGDARHCIIRILTNSTSRGSILPPLGLLKATDKINF
jgi:hypothetical protein